MAGIVPDPQTLALYLGAAVALILAPGPDTVYVLTRGIQSRAAGVRSALGVSTGVLLHTLAAALGLAALLRAAPTAYSLVKYVGAAYLVYLGVQAVRNDEFALDDATETTNSYLRGVAVNALNPKVALFFLAFLPQFAGDGPDATARMALLGFLYAVVTAGYLSAVALASNRARRLVATDRLREKLQWGAGSVFVLLGLSVALDA
ncbi:Threonine/homoserine/homoserine lactone efflux protein [Halogranum gelatinilyticum]|uniref:Threonine/homoserine/homoserine lactone efflux protein n=1 Tax=Halogranum gelatinilyticum TaxID=660521 RepID=A0A1G9P6F6_9EURY|nr:LysE family translocator [Halogranum gelatinilyticum]SDL94081.1 Threonine/homoserine/homoserine lactone efflux protein [Halogranum gelatinilyticum]